MNRRITITAAALLWAVCTVPPSAAEDRAQAALAALDAAPGDRELLLKAVELLPEGPSPRAAALDKAGRSLLEKDPADHAGYLAVCKSLRCSGRTQEAVSNCRRALELDPTAYPVYRELGLSYAAAGNHRKAVETMEQGLELSSASYKARYDLARLLETTGDSRRAAPHYAKAAALAAKDRGEDGEYYAALARAGSKRTAAPKPLRAPRPKAAPAAAPAPAPATAAARKAAPGCMEKFKAEVLKSDPGAALAQSDICLKLMPADPELAAGRAPLMVRLGKYEEGVREYERAAALYSPDAAMAAFCRVKAAQTWLKLGDTAKATQQYRLALKANPSDLNALKGLAAAQEAGADLKGAEATYEIILKADPSDAKTRARREELKTAAMSDAEMLEELRLRQAADPAKTAPAPEDLKLFKAIKAAELAGGVDYVQQKAQSAKGLVAQRRAGETPRLVLTAAGYKAYVFHATRDAIKFFEGEGIGLREIFKLRTLDGLPVFDASGKLTAEGEDLWRAAAPGKKTWLLPYDAVPTSPQAVQAGKDITEAEKAGYREISEPEYLWLLKATTCPGDVLKSPPLNVKEFQDGTRSRYLLCYIPTGVCMTDENSKLPHFIEQYRNNELDTSGKDSHTGFFGGAGGKKRHFCENGQIWRGE